MAGAAALEVLAGLGRGILGAATSSNQVGRTDWTPMGLAELAVLMLSLCRLWYTGGIIHAGTNCDKLYVPDDLQVLRLDFGRDSGNSAKHSTGYPRVLKLWIGFAKRWTSSYGYPPNPTCALGFKPFRR